LEIACLKIEKRETEKANGDADEIGKFQKAATGIA
jgi:hypothetical protein